MSNKSENRLNETEDDHHETKNWMNRVKVTFTNLLTVAGGRGKMHIRELLFKQQLKGERKKKSYATTTTNEPKLKTTERTWRTTWIQLGS